MGSTAVSASDLHMLFFPYMAQGHMLPMIDMAKTFSFHGATVTILTTPANSLIIGPAIDRYKSSTSSSSPISLHVIPFPSAAAGLPPGCENRSSLPSESLRLNFYRAVGLLRLPFDQVLRSLRPDAVVTDMFMPWTYQIAADHGIPRLIFDGTGFFSRCAEEAFSRFRHLDSLPADSRSDAFILPGLPHRIEMLPSQFLEFSSKPPATAMAAAFDEINNLRKEVDPKSYGAIVNSFYELEPDYVDHYRKVMGRKAWHVGPVSLCNENRVDRASRGRSQSEADRFLDWLDGNKKGSVIYICFGSAAMVSGTQLREIARGLEASGFPFLWVLPRVNSDDWVPDGFQEKGMVVRGWAPQLLILNHEAVGGFVTHCGWNSITEGIAAGLPMVTWPLFAEQFYNERLLVDVVKVAVAVGSKVYSLPGEEGGLVGASEVEEAVRKVMGEGEEAEERRRRAIEMARKARRAVEEGGSSYEDARNLIRDLLERKAEKITGE